MNALRTARIPLWQMVGAITAATTLLYYRALGFGYIGISGHDDAMNILENPHLGQAGGWTTFWAEPFQQLYIPVVYTLWHLTAVVTGAAAHLEHSPQVFHTLNLCFHLLNVALVAALFTQASLSKWAVVFATAFFALHPVQVEPVAWVTGFKDLCLAFFVLTSLLTYTAGIRAPANSRRWLYLSASLVAFALASLSKPTAVALPLAWVVWARCVHSVPVRRQWGFCALGLGFSVLVTRWTMQAQSDIWTPRYPSIFSGALIAADTALQSVAKWIFPWGLTFDTGRAPFKLLSTSTVWASLVGVVISLVVLVRFLPVPALGTLGLSLCFFLPVSGLRPFVQQIYSSYADRYQYLPLVGFSFFLGLVLERLASKSPRYVPLVAGLLVLFLSTITFRQVSYWQSSETLAQRALDVRPASWFGHRVMSNLLQAQGDYETAASHLAQAINDVAPQVRWMYFGQLSELTAKMGHPAQAQKLKTRAYQLWTELLLDQAHQLLEKGAFSQAQLRFRKVLEISPEEPRALAGLRRIPAGTPSYTSEDPSGILR